MRNIKSEINNLMNQIDQRKWHKQVFEDTPQYEDVNVQEKVTEPEIDSLTFSPGFIKNEIKGIKSNPDIMMEDQNGAISESEVSVSQQWATTLSEVRLQPESPAPVKSQSNFSEAPLGQQFLEI